MVALTEIAEERQPEHVFFCHPFFCDADILVARARCMFKISYNYDARIAVH